MAFNFGKFKLYCKMLILFLSLKWRINETKVRTQSKNYLRLVYQSTVWRFSLSATCQEFKYFIWKVEIIVFLKSPISLFGISDWQSKDEVSQGSWIRFMHSQTQVRNTKEGRGPWCFYCEKFQEKCSFWVLLKSFFFNLPTGILFNNSITPL